MKIAIVSDIHSNIFALEAVINHFKRKSVDIVVNLGDILYGPIAPQATYERLRALKDEFNLVTIRGNQDRHIYEADEAELKSNSTMAFIHEDLSGEAMDWMRALPFDRQLTDYLYLCHGTPDNDLIYLLEDVSSGHAQLREDSEIESLLAGNKSKIILCGHTHTPRDYLLKQADRTSNPEHVGDYLKNTNTMSQRIINPGSVGLQAYSDDLPVPHIMQTKSPEASYTLLELGQNKNIYKVSHEKVSYDVDSAARLAKLRGRDDWVKALETGYALDES